MIPGHEHETEPLTDAEMVLVPKFIAGLRSKVGKENAITASQMAEGIKRSLGVTVTGPRIRKIINYIRRNALVPRLMATSDGYYIAADRAELVAYIDGLKQRESAIAAMRMAIEKQVRDMGTINQPITTTATP